MQVSLDAHGNFSAQDTSVQEKEDGAVLVHPVTDGLTIAEISGLSFYGDMAFDFVVALENSEAASVEVRAIMVPEKILFASRLRQLFEASSISGFSTDWVRMDAEDRALLSLRTHDLGPCATLYIASRGAEGRVEFAWLHLRRIIAARVPKVPSSTLKLNTFGKK
jgi:hypothetical protein